MFRFMAKSFTTAAVQPTLTEMDVWNDEVAEAWDGLFQLIVFGMQRAYTNSSEAAAASNVSNKDHDDNADEEEPKE